MGSIAVSASTTTTWERVRRPARRRASARPRRRRRAALAALSKLHAPFFLWVHYFDPHEEYRPPARIAAKIGGPHKLYDGEIAYADEQIGALLAAVPVSGGRRGRRRSRRDARRTGRAHARAAPLRRRAARAADPGRPRRSGRTRRPLPGPHRGRGADDPELGSDPGAGGAGRDLRSSRFPRRRTAVARAIRRASCRSSRITGIPRAPSPTAASCISAAPGPSSTISPRIPRRSATSPRSSPRSRRPGSGGSRSSSRARARGRRARSPRRGPSRTRRRASC